MVSGFFHNSVARSIGCSIDAAIGVAVRTYVDEFVGSAVGSHLELGLTRSAKENLTSWL